MLLYCLLFGMSILFWREINNFDRVISMKVYFKDKSINHPVSFTTDHSKSWFLFYFFYFFVSGHFSCSMLSAGACPTGDQEVAGSTLAEVGNILSWSLIMKYFLRSFSPFR